MAININNNLLSPANARGSETRERQADGISSQSTAKDNQSEATRQPESRGSDSVNLSSEGKNLRQIEERLSGNAQVDADKVARIKQSLADGSYTIDARKLAENMFNMEQQLSKP